MLSEEQKRKVEREVTKELVLAFRVEGIDFLAFDKKTMNHLIIAFQVGVTFWEKKRRQFQEEAMQNTEEIPF